MSDQQHRPGEWLTATFRAIGLEFSEERARDRLRAERERQKYNDVQLTDRVRALATQVKRARREAELCEFDWRSEPGQDTLAAAREAQRARLEIEGVLLEALSYDRALFNSVMKSV
jgi:hypothetical protein